MLTITHILFGLILWKFTGNFLYVLLGSTIIDLDHYFQFKKEGAMKSLGSFYNRLFNPKKNTSAKIPMVHSLTGWLIFMNIFLFISKEFAIFFGLGYLGHLLLDLFDNSQKQFLWPIELKHKGPIKYNSLVEYVIITGLVILLLNL